MVRYHLVPARSVQVHIIKLCDSPRARQGRRCTQWNRCSALSPAAHATLQRFRSICECTCQRDPSIRPVDELRRRAADGLTRATAGYVPRTTALAASLHPRYRRLPTFPDPSLLSHFYIFPVIIFCPWITSCRGNHMSFVFFLSFFNALNAYAHSNYIIQTVRFPHSSLQVFE
jgi:hypothetical protein